MAKKRPDEDVIESLEKEIKQLKAEVRLLQKRLKRASRNQRDEDVDDEEDEKPSKSSTYEVNERCPDCSKGYIIDIPLGPRKQQGCESCGWRGKITKK